MKVKIVKLKGLQKLVVDDADINEKSQYGSPIVLAKIDNYFDSKCWSFEDYRLTDHLIPSAYLNDSNEQIINFSKFNDEDKYTILSKLTDYEINDDGSLFYHRYNCVNLDGDIPRDDPRRKWSDGDEYPRAACFSFKEARKKLKEAKEFWESTDLDLTDPKIKLPNKNLQPHYADFFFDLSFNKEKLESYKKNKP